MMKLAKVIHFDGWNEKGSYAERKKTLKERNDAASQIKELFSEIIGGYATKYTDIKGDMPVSELEDKINNTSNYLNKEQIAELADEEDPLVYRYEHFTLRSIHALSLTQDADAKCDPGLAMKANEEYVKLGLQGSGNIFGPVGYFYQFYLSNEFSTEKYKEGISEKQPGMNNKLLEKAASYAEKLMKVRDPSSKEYLLMEAIIRYAKTMDPVTR